MNRKEAAAEITTTGVRPLSDREFALFQGLIYREAGIHLGETKKALLAARLGKRVRELGLPDFTAYHRTIESGDDDERRRMLDCICTNETSFFREPKQFEFLETEVFPRWRQEALAGIRPRRIRAWSAACSTGEEPYSLAMTLAANFPEPDWNKQIVASDLSTTALDRARTGIWPIERANTIPERYRKAYLMRGTRSEEGRMCTKPEIRSMIGFCRLNLNASEYPIGGAFDLIFCRNVLIYFSRDSRAAVIDRLLRHLTPDGILFLGHAESLTGWSHRVRCVGPTAYTAIGASSTLDPDRAHTSHP